MQRIHDALTRHSLVKGTRLGLEAFAFFAAMAIFIPCSFSGLQTQNNTVEETTLNFSD